MLDPRGGSEGRCSLDSGDRVFLQGGGNCDASQVDLLQDDLWLTPEGADAEVRERKPLVVGKSSEIYERYMQDFSLQELSDIKDEYDSCDSKVEGSFFQQDSSGPRCPSPSQGLDGRLGQVVKRIAERERPSGECIKSEILPVSCNSANFIYHSRKVERLEQNYIGYYKLESGGQKRESEEKGKGKPLTVPVQTKRYELATGTVGLLNM